VLSSDIYNGGEHIYYDTEQQINLPPSKIVVAGIQPLAVGDFSMGWMRYSARPVRP